MGISMIEDSKNCIAKRLKEVRLAFGISQKKLGILVEIDEQSASVRMNQCKTGKHVPNFLTLQHIGKVLGHPTVFFSSDDDFIAELICWTGKLWHADKQRLLDIAKTLDLNHDRKLFLVEG